jgi:alpha-ketoglutarate-dependent taurine dioxygenase
MFVEDGKPIGNLGDGEAVWHADMCHEWKVGDLLMWNNLAVLHRRDPSDPKARCVMHRSQIKGSERIA